MAGNLEFVQGSESHSSNWGKYYVKGLEKWQVKEDFEGNVHDRHHSYQGYVCNDVPDGTVFTIFEQNGDKRGTDTFIFSVCVVDQGEVNKDTSSYGNGFTSGNYKVLCTSGNSKTKGPRLLGWWQKCPPGKEMEWALHCAAHIDKRGQKEIPPLPETKPEPSIGGNELSTLLD